MTIQAAIDRIDEMVPNMFSDQQKVAWLSEVDGYVFREIFLTHEGMPPGIVFEGYDQDTEMSTALMVHEPYHGIYEHYLAAKMAEKNREMGEYAKEMTAFNSAWQTFADYYGRKHMPIQLVHEFRF